MKRYIKYININLFFIALGLLTIFGNHQKVYAQGFNNNQWIFGYCEPGQENSYLSFGRGEDPVVRTLDGNVIVGENNVAIAIDPITGNVIFYTNGELIYDGDDEPMQGQESGINGDFEGRQKVAIATLVYEPNEDRLFYIFYMSPVGQLQYALIDMNAPGQALPNQPPLGQVIQKDVLIANGASGAVAVIKTPQSPSYLISFEGGELVARIVEANQGDFTVTGNLGFPFSPKAIIFDESGKLILIPEGDGEDIAVLDFDTSTGSFGNLSFISNSGGNAAIEGAAFSPDGDFIYFSRGDQLLRVPANDLDADPEVIPLEGDIDAIFDIKVGPDGRLYYIYEETPGGPQLIGRVNNPDEEDLEELEIEEDPFNGTDFCGRVFPQFAPNQDVNPEVDFDWEPIEPCANNPIQLTSEITPLNYRPVSFEWTFNPPLTDEDGELVDIDFNQEHLLIPQEATSGESVTVTLVVTFANGQTSEPRTQTIDLRPNDLEANFTPQDTTLCSPNCINLTPLLQVQQGDGQGGESPGGIGGVGGNYEYFWSNKREWGPEAPNEVCRPGLYWVLVREPGSECFAYAEIRVKIWDLPDQSNNVWLFGNGAGLDFNPDPDDPDAPRPIPIEHPNEIPAGTATISDETGQVLFYTDGQTVWDLNGIVMPNGEDIGGSNQTSQGVIAVPVPQNPTIFYVFTTEAVGTLGNQVSFSVVDLTAENETGAGAVTSSNNFLFSPATEQVAALATGATNWVLFHELGNNTFRAYPLTEFGIGQPVFSSVGSSHGFGAGVGTMKFSPDGSQVAVTINDGACSSLEIFDFDQETGRLTEYALLTNFDCNDQEIYGVEFSPDGSRIFVSYTGSPGKIEEYLVKRPETAVEGEDIDSDLSCFDCFNNASNRSQRENCIIDSRNVLSTAGPFGAIQIGPDGQIYVARPGANEITAILPGFNCLDSFYNEQGVSLLPDTSMNLGLPAFVQQSGSSIPEPALAGIERLCFDPENGTIGLFEAGGEPDIDSYFWTITHEDGEVVFQDGGPGETFQGIEPLFPRVGIYTVALEVDRCGDPEYYRESMEVEVIASPELTLPEEATLCVGSPVQLTAIDGYDPAEGLYDFEWRNAAGQLIGDENSNTIEVLEESVYTVTVSFRVPDGLEPEEFDTCPVSRSIFVGPAFDFDIVQSAEEVCLDEPVVVFAPNTPITGQWFFRPAGSTERAPLGEFFELELIPASLPSPGEYEIIFLAEDPLVEGCFVEKIAPLTVFPLPVVDVEILSDAEDCEVPDGSFEITALSDIESLEIRELGLSFPPIAAGETLPAFTDLEPGLYTLEMVNGFGCQFTQSVTIRNLNPPQGIEGYEVDVSPEICDATGVLDGQLIIRFVSGQVSGAYQITRQGDGAVFPDTFTDREQIIVSVPAGLYAVVVEDVDGCAVPFEDLVEVEEVEIVGFSAPGNVEACESFTFSPQSEDELIYTLRDAQGNQIQATPEGSFTITEAGLYVLTGEDPDGIKCAREREINVTLTTAPVFSLVGPRVDCDLGLFYEAVLGPNEDPNQVFIFWLDSNGQVVSRNPLFFPRTPGTYFLEVQPRIGSLCEIDPISFTVEDTDPQIDVTLEALPFCAEDPFTVITIIADLSDVAQILWFEIVNGERELIENWVGFDQVVAEFEGLFELVLISNDGCEIGSAEIEIIQSRIGPPELEELYEICAPEGIVVEIDPGVYDNYEWVLDGEVVAVTPTFSPTIPGEYELIVSDDLGCEFRARFVVEEDCELKINFPNAIIPNDSERNFVVYTNDFVDELEVFIYNRWGELIFYCESNGVNGEVPLCTWDGIVNGKTVPIGTYPVIVKYGSTSQNISKTLKRAILVIE